MMLIKLVDARKGLHEKCIELLHDEKVAESIYMYLCDGLEECDVIEPERKTGKWIERNPQNSDKCRLIECDQCGFSHIVGFNVPYEHWIENRNFCERCGADMRGEQNENR